MALPLNMQRFRQTKSIPTENYAAYQQHSVPSQYSSPLPPHSRSNNLPFFDQQVPLSSPSRPYQPSQQPRFATTSLQRAFRAGDSHSVYNQRLQSFKANRKTRDAATQPLYNPPQFSVAQRFRGMVASPMPTTAGPLAFGHYNSYRPMAGYGPSANQNYYYQTPTSSPQRIIPPAPAFPALPPPPPAAVGMY